jgi:acyl-CoA thioester hydrolase
MVHKRFILFAMTSGSSSAVTSVVEFRVRYAETDQMKVVHHRNYLVWCELGRTDLIRMLGTSYAEIEKQGVLLAVVEANLRYHAPARYDDKIRVRTVLREARSRSVTFEYTIENADTGEKLVTARTMLASINGEGKLVSMPEHMRRSLEAAVA